MRLQFWIGTLLAGCAIGCEAEPPPPKNGIQIQAPGVNVNINDGGVRVQAPGTRVNVDAGGVDVKAPGADVKVGP